MSLKKFLNINLSSVKIKNLKVCTETILYVMKNLKFYKRKSISNLTIEKFYY